MKRARYLVVTLALLFVSVLVMVPASARDSMPSKDGGPQGIMVLDGSPVHDAGNLRVHAPNWGMFGSMPGSGNSFSSAPSAEWPAGSGVEYLFLGGLWVGGLEQGIPAVSTAGFQFEFRPSDDPRDIVYETAYGAAGGRRIPSPMADDDADGSLDEDILDGYDNDSDGLIDEDYAAVSDQMLSRIFRDDKPGITSIFPQHNPMGLAVRMESYQFSHADYDDFVGFTFWIRNDGGHVIEDAYVSLFLDGDVGHRDTPNYWEDDVVDYNPYILVDHGAHGMQTYNFAYWYDADGDMGQAPGYGGVVILGHPTDPTGVEAPQQVGVVTYANFSGSASYEDGGDPTNDFERFELISSRTIDRAGVIPRDYRTLVAVGPFLIAPGETIEFSCALVVTPRADFTHVQRAAEAYHGLWFDLDNNPNTGVDGKEHQEHWYLPNTGPVPVAISRFEPRVEDGAVHLTWETREDANLAGFEILRAEGTGVLRSLVDGMVPADRREYTDRDVEPGARYDYQLRAHDDDGWTAVSQRVSVTVPSVGLSLRPNAPNPFASETTVSFTLPERGAVELAVYDVAGGRVATIFSGEKTAGAHDVQWDGRDDSGRLVSAGIYFCRIEAGKQSVTRKMLVIR